MINIHDKLWVAKSLRIEDDSEHPLAYMTHEETKADGEDTQAFISRKHTGTNWASRRNRAEWNEGKQTTTFENTPCDSFKIVGSVSRWSTDNKVIRVEDPRGFVVEVPTGNLTTLLKHCTVDHGVVQEKCVWGREGGNHLLLPVNSDVYRESIKKIEKHDQRVSFSKLSKGDVVRFHVDDKSEYVYMGKAKAVWDVQQREAQEKLDSARPYYRWKTLDTDPVVFSTVVKDDKYNHVFLSLEKLNGQRKWISHEYKQSGKAVVERNLKDTPDIGVFEVAFPNRFRDDSMNFYPRYEKIYTTCKTIRFEWKETK